MLVNAAIVPIVLISSIDALCTTKNVTVNGQLVCGPYVARDVKVQLREYDFFDPDDKLNETVTDIEGKFTIYGAECEFGKPQPYIRVEHNCDNGEFTQVICKF